MRQDSDKSVEVEVRVEDSKERTMKYSKGLVVGDTLTSQSVRGFIRRQENKENVLRNEIRKARKVDKGFLVFLSMVGVASTLLGIVLASVVAITLGVFLAVGAVTTYLVTSIATITHRRQLITLEEEIKESKLVSMFKVLGNINNRDFSLKGDRNELLKLLNTKYKTKDRFVRLYEVLGVEGDKVVITEDLYVITMMEYSEDKYSYELEFLDAYKLYKRLREDKRDNLTASEYLGLSNKEVFKGEILPQV